jgi:hypothetical protein
VIVFGWRSKEPHSVIIELKYHGTKEAGVK